MIIDKFEYIERYDVLHESVFTALSFIRNADLTILKEGKHKIDYDDIFYFIDEFITQPAEEGKLEVHRKYINIQAMISGYEYIGHELLSDQEVHWEYDEENDYALYNGIPSFFKLEEDAFAIFFPNDLHMPGINKCKNKVKKIVMKIRI